MRVKLFLPLVIFAYLFSASAPAQKSVSEILDSDSSESRVAGNFTRRKITGKVVGVHDGDTATVLNADKVQYKFRLNGIDAPELKMDFGQRSKQNLSDLIFGKTVTVEYLKADKYGRYVGTVFIDGKDVNLEQIKAGMAWHYKKYAREQSPKDRQTYAKAETKARDAKLGFWSLPNSSPPWEYRTGMKAKQAEQGKARKYLIGSRGGCYYVNSSGKKSYVAKKLCADSLIAP